MKDDHRSYLRNFCSCEPTKRKPENKIRLVRYSNPWALRYRTFESNPVQALIFLGFLFATAKVAYITARIILHLILHSALHIYDFSYIHNFIIILPRVYNEPIQRPAPSWLVSLIVSCTGIAEVKGSIPVKAWIFFKAFFSQLQKLRI